MAGTVFCDLKTLEDHFPLLGSHQTNCTKPDATLRDNFDAVLPQEVNYTFLQLQVSSEEKQKNTKNENEKCISINKIKNI